MKQQKKTDRLLARSEKELQMLYRVIEVISTLDLQTVLHEIVLLSSDLTNADAALVYLLDHKTNTLVLSASKNPHKKIMGHIQMKLGEGITGWVAREKKPVAIAENSASDNRFKFFADLPEDTYQAFLSVPILTKKGVVGVINIQHKTAHHHSENEINLLSAVGKIIGGAVENIRLLEESQALKEALETRKQIEIAKGIIMKNLKISEDDAFQRLQKQSMNLRKSIRQVAEAIILADQFHKI